MEDKPLQFTLHYRQTTGHSRVFYYIYSGLHLYDPHLLRYRTVQLLIVLTLHCVSYLNRILVSFFKLYKQHLPNTTVSKMKIVYVVSLFVSCSTANKLYYVTLDRRSYLVWNEHRGPKEVFLLHHNRSFECVKLPISS